MIDNNLNLESKLFDSGLDKSFSNEKKHIQSIKKLAYSQYKRIGDFNKNSLLYSFINTRRLFQLPFKNARLDSTIQNPQYMERISSEVKEKAFSQNYITIINGIFYQNLSKIENLKNHLKISQDFFSEDQVELKKIQEYLTKSISEEIDIFALINYLYSSFHFLKFSGSFKNEIQIFFFFEKEVIQSYEHIWVKYFNLFFLFSEGSNFNFIIHFLSNDCLSKELPVFQNFVQNFILEKDSKVTIYFIQENDFNFHHIEKCNFFLYKNALLNYFNFLKSSLFHRKTFYVNLIEKDSTVNFNSLTIVMNSSNKLNEIHQILNFNHLDKETFSNQKIKNLIDGKTHCSLSSNIFIDKNAKNCISDQIMNNILLSEKSKISNHPNLNIHIDDVKCTHGATIGYIQEDWIFYLQSRGIPKSIAKEILLQGFYQEIIFNLPSNLKSYFLRNLKYGKI